MTNLVAKIEARLTENKASVKTYTAYDSAVTVDEQQSSGFNEFNGTDVDVEYIVVFLPTTQRWSVVFNLSKWSMRANTGTYIGWFAQKGFCSI